MKKNKILILFAHPLYEKSRVNQIINNYIPDSEYITFNDLYEEYPDFEIDTNREQDLILNHDIIIWQHPFYWYSCPALLKQWMDMVLHFETENDLDIHQLKGKAVFQVMSIGPQNHSYLDNRPDDRDTLDYLLPFQKTVEFSNMQYLPPYMVRIDKMNSLVDIHKKGRNYGYILEALISNFVSAQEILQFKSLNDWLTYKQKPFG